MIIITLLLLALLFIGSKTKFFMFSAQSPFGLWFATGFKIFNQLLAAFNLCRVAGYIQVKHSMLIWAGMH